MASLLDEVIGLSESVTALSPEQKERILKIAPTLPEADLEKLKAMILEVKNSFESAEHELDVRKGVEAKYKVFKKEKAMDNLHEAEAKAQTEEIARAESLLNNI